MSPIPIHALPRVFFFFAPVSIAPLPSQGSPGLFPTLEYRKTAGYNRTGLFLAFFFILELSPIPFCSDSLYIIHPNRVLNRFLQSKCGIWWMLLARGSMVVIIVLYGWVGDCGQLKALFQHCQWRPLLFPSSISLLGTLCLENDHANIIFIVAF